jgi:hypothetical protein
MLLYRCAAKPVKPERKRRGCTRFQPELSISSLPVCLIGDHPERRKDEVHAADPSRRLPHAEVARGVGDLSADEQKAVYGFLEGRLAELGTPPYAPDP